LKGKVKKLTKGGGYVTRNKKNQQVGVHEKLTGKEGVRKVARRRLGGWQMTKKFEFQKGKILQGERRLMSPRNHLGIRGEKSSREELKRGKRVVGRKDPPGNSPRSTEQKGFGDLWEGLGTEFGGELPRKRKDVLYIIFSRSPGWKKENLGRGTKRKVEFNERFQKTSTLSGG